jgi:hypothetical protein
MFRLLIIFILMAMVYVILVAPHLLAIFGIILVGMLAIGISQKIVHNLKNSKEPNLKAITQKYLNLLKHKHNIKAKEHGDDLEHCLWMLEKMNTFGKRDLDKLNRWIGFVQGILYREKIFTIDQMRNHVREITI